MKKFLLFFLLFALVGFTSKVTAQCTVTNIIVSNIQNSNQNGVCFATFDLSFDLNANNGNKIAGFYVYSGSLPTNFYGTGNNAGKTPNTASVNAQTNILAAVEVNADVLNGGSLTNSMTSYQSGNNDKGQANPTAFQPGIEYTPTTISSSTTNFSFKGVKVQIAGCNTAILNLNLDIFATQSTFFEGISCRPATQQITVNAPALSGVLRCETQRAFAFSVLVPVATNMTFTAYRINTDGTKTILSAPAGYTYTGKGGPIQGLTNGGQYKDIKLSVAANDGNSFGLFDYVTPTNAERNLSVYLEIKLDNIATPNSLTIKNTCAVLPVTLKSFEARRTSKEKVALNWITSSESNNSGFDVQRKDGNGEWKTVSFVMSQARNGNSDNNLSYQYIDNNSTSGISQYRLRQVDIDRRATLSEIRSIRGEEMAGNKVNVFPNPSQDGKVNLLFEDKNTSRNITVSDMTGRIIKQYRAIRDNSLTIEGLENGMYNIHITDMTTSATNVEKVIIKKR